MDDTAANSVRSRDPHVHDFQIDIDAISRIDAVPTILDVVCQTTGMGFAAVARVTETRWVACGVRDLVEFGLEPGGELKVETTICNEIRDHREVVVIDNVAEDPTYCNHHTPAMYGLQSYISMPIILPSGEFFGTLCAIDAKPRKLNTPATLGMFKLFAELIAFHLDAHRQLKDSRDRLDIEEHKSELREQFIAVLGHDLRNPLASFTAGTRLLGKEPQTPKAQGILLHLLNTTMRMSLLVENMLDFARGRLGGGITIDRAEERSAADTIDQVINEARTSSPDRVIAFQHALSVPIRADHARIAQMFGNLLGNAIAHGAAEKPVRVEAVVAEGEFRLSVANAGKKIPEEMLGKLFQPYFRGSQSRREGLGLGLYIASEIAKAHGGRIEVSSSDDETKFTFSMPLIS